MNDVRLFEARFTDEIRGPVKIELIQDTGKDNLNHAKHYSGQTLFRRDDEDFDSFRDRCYREWGKSQRHYCAIFEKRGGRFEQTNY